MVEAPAELAEVVAIGFEAVGRMAEAADRNWGQERTVSSLYWRTKRQTEQLAVDFAAVLALQRLVEPSDFDYGTGSDVGGQCCYPTLVS